MKKILNKVLDIIDSKVFFHISSSLILLLSLVATFTTHRISIYRIKDAALTFFYSAKYYLEVVILGAKEYGSDLPELPSVQFYELIEFIPFDVYELVHKIKMVFPAMFDFANFITYTYYFMYVFMIVVYFAMLVWIFIYLFKELLSMVLSGYSKKHKEDTASLRVFKKVVEKPFLAVAYRVIYFCKLFWHLKYYKIPFVVIWLFNLNIYSLVIEVVSRIFVFSASSNFELLLVSISVLFLDLLIVFFSAPLPFWIALASTIFFKIRKKWGYDKLDHLYRQDMGFLKSCGYNILLEGETGASKTKNGVMISRMFDDLFHTDQWESMHECHLEYPDFPFYELQEDISREMEKHTIFNLHTAREFAFFKFSIWLRRQEPANIWGYEGRMFYNDGCRLVPIWEMVSDYCQLYFMYSLDATAICSNISIRTDLMQIDGYFPLWDNNMIQREPELYEEYTRYCHILDYDALRFGVPMDVNNERIGSADFGVNFNDELDKDRGNQDTNKIFDASSEEANTLNDGFDAYLMFERHLALVRFKCYVRNIGALQRDENFKAREKSLFDRTLIADNLGMRFALPMFFEYPIYKMIDGWFSSLEKSTYHYGNIHTLPFYLLKRLFSPFFNYCRRTVFQFGYDIHLMQRMKACNENNIIVQKFFTLYCIAHGNAYASDCYSMIADEISKSVDVGMIDFPSYAGKYPQAHEFEKQHSYFASKQLDRVAKSKERKK